MPAPRQPQDRQRPAAESAITPATFEHDGQTYTLPVRSAIKSGMLRRHRNKDELDFMFSLLEEASDKETLEALDELDIDELNEVIGRWQQHVFPDGDAGKS